MVKRTKEQADLITRTKDAALARNRKRLAELLALVRRRMIEVVEGFYDIGEAFREILDHKLFAADGHKSMAAMLVAEKLMSYRQASKLIKVVRRVPREEALSLGQERAYALVAYTDATPDDDSPAGLLAANAPVGGKPLRDASLRDIEAATQETRTTARVKRPKSAAAKAKAKSDEAIAKHVRATLRDAGLGRIEVTVGRDVVTVRIPRAKAEASAKAR
jgi:hypothetical protein